MVNVLGVNVGAAQPILDGDHIYDFSPEKHVMCFKCMKAAKVIDELFTITTSELLLDNLTRWRRLVIGIITIG